MQRPCGWRECGPFGKELKGPWVGTYLVDRSWGGKEGETQDEAEEVGKN